MESVLSGASHYVDDAAGSSPVVGRIVTSEDRDLFDGINSQIIAQHAAGSSIRIIIDTDAIEPVTVLVWPRSGNAHGGAESAVGVASTRCASVLHPCDSGLQGGKLRPVAPVQRSIADRRGIGAPAYRGAALADECRRRDDSHNFFRLPWMHYNIQNTLDTRRNVNFRPKLSSES